MIYTDKLSIKAGGVTPFAHIVARMLHRGLNLFRGRHSKTCNGQECGAEMLDCRFSPLICGDSRQGVLLNTFLFLHLSGI